MNKNYPIVNKKRKKEFDDDDDDGDIILNDDDKSNILPTYDPDDVYKNEDVDEYMKYYERKIKINTILDLFVLVQKRELPKEEHEFATLCDEIIIILKSILIHGFEDDSISDDEFKSNLLIIRNLFKSYRVINYSNLNELILLNKTNKLSLSSTCYILELHILLILYKFDYNFFAHDDMTEDELDVLRNNNLICFSYKSILKYTQNEMLITMNSLSEYWRYLNELPSSNDKHYEILTNYINLIETRLSELCILHFNESVLDGRDRIEKLCIKKGDIFAVSYEFVANIASIMSHIQISMLTKERLFLITSNNEPVELSFNYWNNKRYVPYLIAGFRSWVKRNVSVMQAAKFRDKIKKTVFNCSLRLGEDETYSRNNGGVSTRNILSIIEQTRTPLQNAYFALELLPIDISSILPSFNTNVETNFKYTYLSSVITALVFRYHCESDLLFPWWMYNVLEDSEYFMQENVIKWRDEPFIIQYLGEFNIWYNKKLYLTYDIDIAIILWCVTMVDKLKCKFVTIEKTFNLNNLKNLLSSWENEGKSIIEQMRQKNITNKYVKEINIPSLTSSSPSSVNELYNIISTSSSSNSSSPQLSTSSSTSSLFGSSHENEEDDIKLSSSNALLFNKTKEKLMKHIEDKMSVDISKL
ncbi:MAG: hypothetical protein MUO21_00640 [Nitrososphaeraceae archaeon]|nr:hypothetical protein [Nitrososphaeraceae archaeon]